MVKVLGLQIEVCNFFKLSIFWKDSKSFLAFVIECNEESKSVTNKCIIAFFSL